MSQFQPGQSGNPSKVFKPGTSGNPNGRPAAAFRASMAARRKATVYRQWLEDIARNAEKDSDKVSAIKVLLTIASGEALRVKLADVDEAIEKLDVEKALQSVAASRHLKLVPMSPEEIQNNEQEREEENG